ncbi:hypothetical protein L0665_05490 [Methanogenium marinum]|uniref:Uncharacterized protein n=1 Tax=Methanogenium marinum TaxID=348610 RepID=A0A9Q4KU42_9EURY|nr:hypothetical protein [Methanogenium marinum]MDE4908062.1 hypothetical protein [Methanogenium marinum]
MSEYPDNSPLFENGNTPSLFTYFTKNTVKTRGVKFLFDRHIPLRNPYTISDPGEISHECRII